MIYSPPLNIPYRPEREKEPDQKLMRLMQHNFQPAGRGLARFGYGGFFSLDYNRWDGLPLDAVIMLRTVFVMPEHRGVGVQRAILTTVELLAHKTGCAVLAVGHTYEPIHPVETEEDFIESYYSDWNEPFRYFGPDSEENCRQNATFKKRNWVNIDVHENIGTWWIKPQHCWIYIPETASPDLIQQLKPRLVKPVPLRP